MLSATALPEEEERALMTNTTHLDEHPYVPAGVLRVRVTTSRQRRTGRGVRGRARRNTRGRGRSRGARGRGRARGASQGPRRLDRERERDSRCRSKRRRLRRVIEESTGSSSSGSSSSENEVQFSGSENDLSESGSGNEKDNTIRRYSDYVGRTVTVPSVYFGNDSDTSYKGVCRRWGRYTDNRGKEVYGYLIYYDDGDKFWMLEEDAHRYVDVE